MENLIDKIIIYICCSVFLAGFGVNSYTIVPLAISVIISCTIIFFNTPSVSIFGYLIYVLLSFIFPSLIFFLPLFLYDLFMTPYVYIGIVCVAPIVYKFNSLPYVSYILISALCVFVFVMRKRSFDLAELKKNYTALRDNMQEEYNKLRSRNKDLLERQEYEVTNATLAERNRIAREIHDTVGHIISRCLLQIGALIAVSPDGSVKEGLNSVKETLSTGMDNIRESIHNLHEDSMNLEDKLNEILDNFTFCETDYTYSITSNMTMKLKYTILYIVKEALSNVIKHSKATKVTIIISEIPSFYQILIHDNGIGSAKLHSVNAKSMGLSSFYERVNEMNGNINVTNDNGFKIYITIPKEDTND